MGSEVCWQELQVPGKARDGSGECRDQRSVDNFSAKQEISLWWLVVHLLPCVGVEPPLHLFLLSKTAVPIAVIRRSCCV